MSDKQRLTCQECTATARDTSKERGRFKRRHPRVCEEFKRRAQQAEERGEK